MPAVHYREPDAGLLVRPACGRVLASVRHVTSDPKGVTCRACPGTMRWNISVHGMTYEQAAKTVRPRYS